ncbi:MAG: M48 family metallopeptidase [Rhizobacter sp.]
MDEPAAIPADYFDGRTARAHPVRLRIEAGRLSIEGDAVTLSLPLADVDWPERTRHGPRVARLRGGASLHSADGAAWDAWLRVHRPHESLVVRAQQSWRGTLAAVAALVLFLGAAYLWGVPWVARGVVAALPHSVDESVGDVALAAVDRRWMRPSGLPTQRQRQVSDAFERALASLPRGSVPPHRLVFRKSQVGPNAFALPGGTIVMTDELVDLAGADEAMLVGVLGHELGHLRHRHGLRQLVEVSVLGALAALWVGDFSTLLAGVPAWIGQAGYSRDAEREADAESVRVLRAAGLSPLAMVRFFEAMAASREGRARAAVPMSISTHPADEERVAFFRAAAAR